MQLCRRSVVEGDDDDERFADPKWMVGGLGNVSKCRRRGRSRRSSSSSWWCDRSLGLKSVAGKFGHGFLRAVVVDECLAGGGGGDQCGDGGVIQRTWQSQAGLVESRNRVVGKQRISPTGQRQVVLQVPG